MRRSPQDFMLVWRGITCRVRHTPDHINRGWSRIEVWAPKPPSPPLPVGIEVVPLVRTDFPLR